MKTYRIVQARQKEVLASSVRQNLLDTLCAARVASVRELARELGMRVTALYYHLQLLERAGLVIRRGTRRGRARHEAVYAARATHIALDYGLDSESGRGAAVRLGRTLLRAAARDFAVGVRSPLARSGGGRRNLWVSRVKAWLTDREIGAVHGHLRAIEKLMLPSRRGPGRTLCAASWVLAPLGVEGKEGSRRSAGAHRPIPARN